MQTRKKLIPYILLVVTVAFVFGGIILFNQKETTAIKKDDREKFSSTVEHFNILEEIALEAMRIRDTTTKESFLLNLKETALLDWAECVNVLDLAEKLDLPVASNRIFQSPVATNPAFNKSNGGTKREIPGKYR